LAVKICKTIPEKKKGNRLDNVRWKNEIGLGRQEKQMARRTGPVTLPKGGGVLVFLGGGGWENWWWGGGGGCWGDPLRSPKRKASKKGFKSELPGERVFT